jgi:carboxypeptidase Taq
VPDLNAQTFLLKRTPEMSFEELDKHNKTLASLDHALAILGADEATNMPSGGGEKRAEAMATLSGMRHKQASAPEIGEMILRAEDEDLSTDARIGLDEFKRQYLHLTCLPPEFVEERTKTAMQAEQLWRQLRPQGDWKTFAPALEEVISLAREEAQIRAAATSLSPYDAMMEQYDPGNRMADIDPIFARLKTELASLLPQALEKQKARHKERPLKPLTGPFPVDQQRALGLAAMKQVGFDFTHGRLDQSHHPFCGGVPSDVRMTTRYDDNDFLPGLMGVLHETGHAQYEQGLPKENDHWPHNLARGMGAHESQSLFVEMQLARSPAFWRWAIGLVNQHLDDVFSGWEVEDVLAHVNRVEPGLIRVDADEITYPMHVIMRYELEQALIAGKLKTVDIPEAWDEKMQQYLGLSTTDNLRDGPMQDVHWPAGLFGYFPSYTLGAMMAAQQWAAMEKDLPEAEGDLARGDFSAINDWRQQKIWQHGARYSTPELMKKATGEPLNPDYFMAHLKKRYL